jgi:GNAT superfamily N-acetyltransferase
MTVIAPESYLRILPELMPLFMLHWGETGLYRAIPGRLKPSPDLEKYRIADQTGMLLTLTARQDGRLVGYFIAFAQPCLHYSETLHCITDLPYVLPDVRHRGIGARLFRAAEKILTERGIKLWQSGSKLNSELHSSMDRLLRSMKFEPTDLIYSKWIGN